MCEFIQVKNPLAESTVVKLHPNQSLKLSLSKEIGVLDIDFDSNFFVLDEDVTDDSGIRHLLFSQKYDLTEWASMSSIYLGEVFILRENACTSLCVILDSKSKANILSIIAPRASQLKLRPTQILEIILYDEESKIPNYTRWESVSVAGAFGIKFEEIKSAIIYPPSFNAKSWKDGWDDGLVPHPRVIDAALEYHYWFKPSLDESTVWPSGSYAAGRIVMVGQSTNGSVSTNSVNLTVRIKSKDRKLFKKPLNNMVFNNYPKRWLGPVTEEVSLNLKELDNPFDGCRVVEFGKRKKPNHSMVICDDR